VTENTEVAQRKYSEHEVMTLIKLVRTFLPALTVSLSCSIAPNSLCSAQSKLKSLTYEPDRVTLVGKVVSRTFYGPPNYGENPATDSKESQYILILDTPVDVIGSTDPIDRTEREVKKLTLVVFDFKANPVESLLGKRVEVSGTLFHAHTGHHHTRVLIEVESIRAVPRSKAHPHNK
jgi:hypothetical protein